MRKIYKVIDKITKKQFGVDCLSLEEAECLQNEHEGSVIVAEEMGATDAGKETNECNL